MNDPIIAGTRLYWPVTYGDGPATASCVVEASDPRLDRLTILFDDGERRSAVEEWDGRDRAFPEPAALATEGLFLYRDRATALLAAAREHEERVVQLGRQLEQAEEDALAWVRAALRASVEDPS